MIEQLVNLVPGFASSRLLTRSGKRRSRGRHQAVHAFAEQLEIRVLPAILSPSSWPTFESVHGGVGGSWNFPWSAGPSINLQVSQQTPVFYTTFTPMPPIVDFLTRWDADVEIQPSPGSGEEVGDPVDVTLSANISGSMVDYSDDVFDTLYDSKTLTATASLGDHQLFAESKSAPFDSFNDSGSDTEHMNIGDTFHVSWYMSGEVDWRSDIAGTYVGSYIFRVDKLLGAINATLKVKPAEPRVIDVVTGGYAADWSQFQLLADNIANLPLAGSDLDGQVKSEVYQWNSSSGTFSAGLGFLFCAEIARADYTVVANSSLSPAEKLVQEANFNDIFRLFGALASATARSSDQQDLVAAKQILGDMKQKYSPDKSSDHIDLIGHSRGAAVNALLYKLLYQQGYANVDYVSLDGYGADWTYGNSIGGDLSTIQIGAEVSGGAPDSERYNIQAANGLVFDPDHTLQLLLLAAPADALAVLREENELRAPPRNGLSDEVLPGTTHTTIVSGANDILGFDSPLYLERFTYVGQHRDDGLEEGLISPSQVTYESVVTADTSVPPTVQPSLNGLYGFVDGSVDELNTLAADLASASTTTTGIPFFDDNLRAAADPLNLISLYWQTTGDVRLAQQSDGAALQLVRPTDGMTSVSQTLVLPDRALSIDVDLGVQSAGSGDQLQILFDGATLATIDLDSPPPDGHVSVSLAGMTATYGTVTFQLVSTNDQPTSITLDNFTVVQVANSAPVLDAGNRALPSVADSDLTSQGVLVSSLLGDITDSDPGALQGLAIVGANPSLGSYQYSIDGGTTWIDVGPVSNSQALLLAPDDSTRVRLVPDGTSTGAINNALTIRAWDQTTGISALNGEYFDATENGGTTPFSATTVDVAAQVLSAPTDITLSATSIAENNSPGALVGTLGGIDSNPADTFQYSLVSGDGGSDNGSFSIVGNMLVLNAAADFETQPSYSIRIRATDENDLTFDKQFTISVLDVNESPTSILLTSQPLIYHVTGKTKPVLLDDQATISDGDGSPRDFNGAVLQVSGQAATDKLSIFGPQGIVGKGKRLLMGKTVIGSISGGKKGAPLTIHLNAEVGENQGTVTSLLRSINFHSTKKATGTRTIHIQITHIGNENTNDATRDVQIEP